jgi:WD40 repeat protein
MKPFQPFQQRKKITKTPDYCLDIISTKNAPGIIGAPMANGSIELLNVETLTTISTIQQPNVLSQCLFDTQTPNILWSSDKSGNLILFDIRTSQKAMHLNASKPILSFDINSSHTLIACGTELTTTTTGIDAPIIFWDLRNCGQSIAQFDDCHSDDVTQIKFHPTQPNAMISGSTDGLVCLYNLETMIEDDALYQVIKDDSVSKIGYFGPQYEYLYYQSHMETFSIWKFENADRIQSFGDVRGESVDIDLQYCIDCKYDEQTQLLYMMAGSIEGNIGIFNVTMEGLVLAYTLNGGNGDIVRGVDWNLSNNYIVSGSEDGAICTWSQ